MSSRAHEQGHISGMASPERAPDLRDSAIRGALAGMAGGMAMMMAMKIEQMALLPAEERPDPPPKRLVESVAARRGIAVSDRQATAAGMGVHMGYSAMWGALYGVVQDRVHPPELLHGVLLGAMVYAGNFPSWGVLPRAGALPAPSEQEPVEAAIPVLAHLVFGVVTAKAFSVLH